MGDPRRWFVCALTVVGLALAPSIAPSGAWSSQAFGAPPRTKPPKPPKKPPATKPDPAPAETPPAEPTLQRSNRMELDARLVRGETARSGAVYLFQRAPRRLPPLVDMQQSYLDEIVVPVLGDTPDADPSDAPVPPPHIPSTPSTPPSPTKPERR